MKKIDQLVYKLYDLTPEEKSDVTSGKKGAIKADYNTIDTQTSYYLNYNMTDEQIADTLLNKGQFEPNFTRYNYLFMPSKSNSDPS